MDNEREELVNELKRIGCFLNTAYIAEFILADRKRIEKEMEPIREKAWKYDQLCK